MRNLFHTAIVLVIAVLYVEGQIIPSRHAIFASTIAERSVNGSSATGLCTDTTMNSSVVICEAPASSVLFDGNVPALVGLDGNMWASQLQTTQLNFASGLNVDFSSTPGFTGLTSVEVVMFNCPAWNITGTSLILTSRDFFTDLRTNRFVTSIPISPDISSCDSFVTYCLNFRRRMNPFFSLAITGNLDGTNWAHIAEVVFHDGTTCTPTTADSLVTSTMASTSSSTDPTTATPTASTATPTAFTATPTTSTAIPTTSTATPTASAAATTSGSTSVTDGTLGTTTATSLSDVLPSRYLIFANRRAGRSVNGSSATGFCTDTAMTTESILTCAAPASSVLFDGSTPALVGLDGNMWASQLQTTELRFVSTFVFDFSDTPAFTGLDTIEIVMFNCPEWGITMRSISLVAMDSFAIGGGQVTDVIEISSNISSCDSFVRFCLNYRRNSPFVGLIFNRDVALSSNTWAHVAEIIFHRGTTCTPSTPTPPPMETTASTSFESTTSTNGATSATTDVPTTIATTDPVSTTTEPTGSLFFMFNGQRLPSGSSLLISDIGATRAGSVLDLGSALACVTSEVNTQCCRNRDGGNVGEWFFPDGSMVPRNRGNQNADFTRSGFTHQVRLNRRNDAAGPEGTYTCRVPDATDSSVIHSATITLEGFRPLPRMVQCFVVVCVWQGPAEGSLEDYTGYEIRFGGQVVFQHENDEFFHVVNGDPRILALGAPQDVTVEVRVSSTGNVENPWTDPVPLSSM